MALALDEIAERIRSLGAFAPGSFSAFAALSAVKEENGRPKAMQMVANLAGDQEIIADLAQKVIAAAEANDDQATVDLAVRRMDVHQKHAWMLRSHNGVRIAGKKPHRSGRDSRLVRVADGWQRLYHPERLPDRRRDHRLPGHVRR